MKIQITLHCPDCQSSKITKNGNKYDNKQNYPCKDFGRQFIGNHALSYKGCHSELIDRILMMLVRGVGIRDIAAVEQVSAGKVLSVLVRSNKSVSPKKQHYGSLEVDEFLTYVGKKENKVWLIYAYDRESGEIVAYVWGKRNIKTVRVLRCRLIELGVSYDTVCTDGWAAFANAFKADNRIAGKANTVVI